ncbi:GNAT family N-acetyltransferase [Dysgonomonas sp. HDW5B]|uniref:GNAT family N-acetyltransferase n=1 Tax=Dysgonomonas sp. HDW5B TaxID=2714927 RepID=UPI00140831A2|nr:GNAT family N-acetyltransferase [Dysgonomonas sp. HDW5B]QIK53246.1 GNAT family N-acetyltransferase [Dysgonomonas sp. HDW5B]
MERNKIRERLTLKPFGLEYIDQFNELLRYVFQVTNSDIQQSGYEDGEIVKSKRPILKNADVIGWFNDDQLVSQLCIYPCQVNIHGKIFSMGGLTGVGTYPEYANLGLMNDLIKSGLQIMKNKGQWISYLYPYSIPYYRRKGWEIMSDHLTFTIKDSQIPKNISVKGFAERLPVTDPDVISVYDKFARSNHGALIRGNQEWEEYWRWENEDERTAAVYYDKEDVPQGYILYWIEEDIFHIKDIIYLNQEARVGLWNFVYAHYSMVDEVQGNIYKNDPLHFLLDDGQIKETIEPYYMARIVDVTEFLNNFPFKDSDIFTPFHFVVSDSIAEWNQGVFGLVKNEKGKLVHTNEAVGNPVYLDIQTLTTMLMSYRSPSYLHKIERLQADENTLEILEQIIPDNQPYFSDYF